jgi:short-subunit dehydrogenase
MIGQKDRYAVITGATSGIGYELAKLLAKDGKNLAIIARDINRLDKVKAEIESKYGTTVKTISKDVSLPEAPLDIFSELEKEDINVDVLVNNAGLVVYGLFPETDFQKELEMIRLYTSALTHMTKLFLKKMIQNKSGWILNVSSGMGFLSVPVVSVYAAGKAYIIHFSEALANELQGSGVSVTCLCPSQTETEIFKRAKIENTRLARAKMLNAAAVAEAGYTGMKKGKVIVATGKSKMLPALIRILPRKTLTKIARSMV